MIVNVTDRTSCAACGDPFVSNLPNGSLQAAGVYCVRNVRVAQEVADLIGPSRWRGMVRVKEESPR